MIKTLFFALCIFSFLHSSETAPKIPIIVDTDMGNDDIMALLSLLKKPNVQVKAITIIGTGLAHPKEGFRNIQRLLSFLNKKEIPIALGREFPVKGGHPFPDSWRTETDKHLDSLSFLDKEAINPIPYNAVELLRKTLESSSEKITLLALGPLTNIADLFRLYPNLKKKIDKIYIMGGAVDVPGNLTVIEDNKVAEWNIFADPLAAKEVFESGIPIYLIALDATNQTPLTIDFYEQVKKNQKTKSAHLFYQMLTDVLPLMQTSGFYFWDLVAAEILADPTLATFEPRTIDIITTEGPNYGQTVSSDTGYPIQLATKVDRKKFLQAYFNTINSDEF